MPRSSDCDNSRLGIWLGGGIDDRLVEFGLKGKSK
jgi:hypothetical protein